MRRRSIKVMLHVHIAIRSTFGRRGAARRGACPHSRLRLHPAGRSTATRIIVRRAGRRRRPCRRAAIPQRANAGLGRPPAPRAQPAPCCAAPRRALPRRPPRPAAPRPAPRHPCLPHTVRSAAPCCRAAPRREAPRQAAPSTSPSELLWRATARTAPCLPHAARSVRSAAPCRAMPRSAAPCRASPCRAALRGPPSGQRRRLAKAHKLPAASARSTPEPARRARRTNEMSARVLGRPGGRAGSIRAAHLLLEKQFT